MPNPLQTGRPAAFEHDRGIRYLTTPIYYVNDAPHLGHAYTTLIGDALARWHRLHGERVHFVTGTDEHGLKVERAAIASGCSPQEWADRVAPRFEAAWHKLNISNDDFVRTTEPRHHAAVLELLQRVYDSGYIRQGEYTGPYCVPCEAYYTLADLEGGIDCPIHHRPVETISEPNYFFELSRLTDQLLDLYASRPHFVRPEGKRNEALAFIRGGLEDFSISRTTIRWGIPLPWDPAHVCYVWFDALTNYLSAIGFGADRARFDTWWPAARHLIGKDILRFHCVYWPAMLLAAGLQPPAGIYVHGFLLVAGEKMSKTRLNRISPDGLIDETGIGVDGFRYHFLRDLVFGPDGEVSVERVIERYNGDLANVLGNLLARVSKLVGRRSGGIGPAPSPASPLAESARRAYEHAAVSWLEVQPSLALDATWQLLRDTNAYLDRTEPWRLPPGAAADDILGDALEALRIVAILASPSIPAKAAELWRRIGLAGRPDEVLLPGAAEWGGYPGGLAVQDGPPLFPRVAIEPIRT
jgi:methionyl-tRNA synthetase